MTVPPKPLNRGQRPHLSDWARDRWLTFRPMKARLDRIRCSTAPPSIGVRPSFRALVLLEQHRNHARIRHSRHAFRPIGHWSDRSQSCPAHRVQCLVPMRWLPTDRCNCRTCPRSAGRSSRHRLRTNRPKMPSPGLEATHRARVCCATVKVAWKVQPHVPI